MIGRTNAVSGGSGVMLYATLNYAVAGITVTATATGCPTKTAVTNASGIAIFKGLKGGYTYTFTTAGGATASELIDTLTENVSLTISRVTVTSSNTGVTQITASKDGVTVTKAYDNGAVFYDLSAGTWTFSDGTESTTAEVSVGADSVVKIGTIRVSIYYQATDYGSKTWEGTLSIYSGPGSYYDPDKRYIDGVVSSTPPAGFTEVFESDTLTGTGTMSAPVYIGEAEVSPGDTLVMKTSGSWGYSYYSFIRPGETHQYTHDNRPALLADISDTEYQLIIFKD